MDRLPALGIEGVHARGPSAALQSSPGRGAGGRRPHATSQPHAVASGAAASEGSPRQRRVAQRRPDKGPVCQARPYAAARLHAAEPWAAEPWAAEPWAAEPWAAEPWAT